MNKFRIGLIVGAVIIIVAELIIIVYDDSFGSKNGGNYLTMIGMVLLIISIVLGIKSERKNLKK